MPATRGRFYTVDVPRLFALWNDTAYTRVEIARELGLTERQLQSSAERHGLGPRGCCRRAFSMEDGANTPEEEAASADSLALAPAVRRRIKELGIGMPVMEHPDVKPWFAVTTEPGPYTEDPEEGYPYDE